MSDDIDRAEQSSSLLLDADIQMIRNKAKMAAGEPGECIKCGDESLRLIKGCCAPCRDKYGLE